MIIEVEDKLVSSEIFDVKFCCDLDSCKGICCVEGNSGAPLAIEEVDRLEAEYDTYKPYMTPEGIEAIERQGFMVVDGDGDLTTPLVDDAECAYTFRENGITLCAIEKAFRDGKTSFQKPISCHLYPIRVSTFSNGTTALNFHRWDVCNCALKLGRQLGTPVYKVLKEPIVRAFGSSFYQTLEEVDQALKDSGSGPV